MGGGFVWMTQGCISLVMFCAIDGSTTDIRMEYEISTIQMVIAKDGQS